MLEKSRNLLENWIYNLGFENVTRETAKRWVLTDSEGFVTSIIVKANKDGEMAQYTIEY